jgi:hypothetical protein
MRGRWSWIGLAGVLAAILILGLGAAAISGAGRDGRTPARIVSVIDAQTIKYLPAGFMKEPVQANLFGVVMSGAGGNLAGAQFAPQALAEVRRRLDWFSAPPTRGVRLPKVTASR